MALCFKGMYRFGEFELNPSERTFQRSAKLVSVSPKAFEVLTYLVSNPGRVVTKEELLQAVWPDSFVEESNLSQHISWLRKALADRSSYIATVPGRGYQFTAKVQSEPDFPPQNPTAALVVHRVRERTHVVIEESSPAPEAVPEPVNSTDRPSSPDFSPTPLAGLKPQTWKIAAAVSALAAVLITVGYLGYKRAANAPFRHSFSIAVLPFANLTGDPAKEYLSDGVTEEMINSLARAEAHQLRVIARTSSMAYKDTHKGVREIAGNWTCNMFSKAAFNPKETACMLRRSLFAATIRLTFGPIPSTEMTARFSNLKTASPAPLRTRCR